MSGARAARAFGATCKLFRTTIQGTPDDVPLVVAALLIAQAEHPDLDVNAYEQRIARIADEARRRLRATAGDPLPGRAAPLHELLFDELGFHGDEKHSGSIGTLLVSDVLDTRRGMPITLALLYVELCRRAGLPADVVGLPGHVIARLGGPPEPGGNPELAGERISLRRSGAAVPPGGPRTRLPENGNPAESSEAPSLVNVFDGGRLLSVDDCRAIVRRIYGGRTAASAHMLAAITPRQTLQRMILSLKSLALEDGDEERHERAIELQLALFSWDLDGVRDRGLLRERSERYAEAIPDLEAYVRHRPAAADARTVAEALRTARAHERERERERSTQA